MSTIPRLWIPAHWRRQLFLRTGGCLEEERCGLLFLLTELYSTHRAGPHIHTQRKTRRSNIDRRWTVKAATLTRFTEQFFYPRSSRSTAKSLCWVVCFLTKSTVTTHSEPTSLPAIFDILHQRYQIPGPPPPPPSPTCRFRKRSIPNMH